MKLIYSFPANLNLNRLIEDAVSALELPNYDGYTSMIKKSDAPQKIECEISDDSLQNQTCVNFILALHQIMKANQATIEPIFWPLNKVAASFERFTLLDNNPFIFPVANESYYSFYGVLAYLYSFREDDRYYDKSSQQFTDLPQTEGRLNNLFELAKKVQQKLDSGLGIKQSFLEAGKEHINFFQEINPNYRHWNTLFDLLKNTSELSDWRVSDSALEADFSAMQYALFPDADAVTHPLQDMISALRNKWLAQQKAILEQDKTAHKIFKKAEPITPVEKRTSLKIILLGPDQKLKQQVHKVLQQPGSTIGSDMYCRFYGSNKFVLNIFDRTGQERFERMNKIYGTKADFVIFCIDSVDEHSKAYISDWVENFIPKTTEIIFIHPEKAFSQSALNAIKSLVGEHDIQVFSKNVLIDELDNITVRTWPELKSNSIELSRYKGDFII